MSSTKHTYGTPRLLVCALVAHRERLDGHAGGRNGHSPQRLDRDHEPLGRTRAPQHQRRLPHVHGVDRERRARERGELRDQAGEDDPRLRAQVRAPMLAPVIPCGPS